jgi:hypothetical protein
MRGGAHGEKELDAVVRAIRALTDPAVGFGFICEEIIGSERAFAAYYDTKHAISINGAGGGLDTAMRCSGLEPAAGVHRGSRRPRAPTSESRPVSVPLSRRLALAKRAWIRMLASAG